MARVAPRRADRGDARVETPRGVSASMALVARRASWSADWLPRRIDIAAKRLAFLLS